MIPLALRVESLSTTLLELLFFGVASFPEVMSRSRIFDALMRTVVIQYRVGYCVSDVGCEREWVKTGMPTGKLKTARLW